MPWGGKVARGQAVVGTILARTELTTRHSKATQATSLDQAQGAAMELVLAPTPNEHISDVARTLMASHRGQGHRCARAPPNA